MLTLSPASSGEVADAVAGAAAKRLPLAITGLGTKAALGRPAGDRYRLDLSGLSGISFYEPEELVLSALAGTPLEQIEALLAAPDQVGRRTRFRAWHQGRERPRRSFQGGRPGRQERNGLRFGARPYRLFRDTRCRD